MTRLENPSLKIFFVLGMILVTGCVAPISAPISGIEPIYPEQIYSSFSEKLITPKVDSVRPVLAWRPITTIDSSDVRRLTYQVRIWETQNGFPAGIAYDKRNINGERHRLSRSLKPSEVYFWSVRAEFYFHNERRLTEWSYAYVPGHGGSGGAYGEITPENYFRFETPAYSSFEREDGSIVSSRDAPDGLDDETPLFPSDAKFVPSTPTDVIINWGSVRLIRADLIGFDPTRHYGVFRLKARNLDLDCEGKWRSKLIGASSASTSGRFHLDCGRRGEVEGHFRTGASRHIEFVGHGSDGATLHLVSSD